MKPRQNKLLEALHRLGRSFPWSLVGGSSKKGSLRDFSKGSIRQYEFYKGQSLKAYA